MITFSFKTCTRNMFLSILFTFCITGLSQAGGRGAHYSHYITTCPPPPEFSDLATALYNDLIMLLIERRIATHSLSCSPSKYVRFFGELVFCQWRIPKYLSPHVVNHKRQRTWHGFLRPIFSTIEKYVRILLSFSLFDFNEEGSLRKNKLNSLSILVNKN